jgi:hypothetical protein
VIATALDEYVVPGRETTFATVVAAARERGETAIGLRIAELSDDASSGYGVRLDPRPVRKPSRQLG